MPRSKSAEVVIVQRYLTHYRVPLFEELRRLLAADGVNLRVLYGSAHAREAGKRDQGALPWAEPLPTHYFFGGRLCWQPFGSATRNADLVVITQENRLLYNAWALLARRRRTHPRRRRIAFWGHGANLQSAKPTGLRERFKRVLVRRVDWWFAYTRISTELVRETGFPEKRITVLENSADTRALAEACANVSSAELADARRRLSLQDARVGLFLGSLYEQKRLPFLVEAGALIVQRIPEFRLLVCGEGAQKSFIEQACRRHDWLRYVGMVQGREKALVLRLAEVMLNPGLVGLSILDAFTAGIALITTDCRIHSPEIAYLRSGENGLMTENSVEAFALGAIALFHDEARRRRLGANAHSVAGRYTIENMAQRFRAGILSALRTPA